MASLHSAYLTYLYADIAKIWTCCLVIERAAHSTHRHCTLGETAVIRDCTHALEEGQHALVRKIHQ